MTGPASGRWQARHKEEVVLAIRDGEISREDARRRHDISEEELSAWMWRFDALGRRGLKVTTIQQVRV